MRAMINKALDQLENLYRDDDKKLEAVNAESIIETIHLVQDAYVEVIQRALIALMDDKQQVSHDLLQHQRDQLDTTFTRISTLIEDVSESPEPMFKLIIEYLFTRARLVDELKMFPDFGLELLDRLTLDESLDETIHYMEKVMTGRSNLYDKILDQHLQSKA